MGVRIAKYQLKAALETMDKKLDAMEEEICVDGPADGLEKLHVSVVSDATRHHPPSCVNT